MTDPGREASRAEADIWIAYGTRSFRIAAHILAMEHEESLLEAAFLLQQAAEKLLKAVLISRGTEPPRIHDLAELYARVGPIPGLPAEVADLLAAAAPWAVQVRYPGLETDALPDAEEARKALSLVTVLRDHVAALIAAA